MTDGPRPHLRHIRTEAEAYQAAAEVAPGLEIEWLAAVYVGPALELHAVEIWTRQMNGQVIACPSKIAGGGERWLAHTFIAVRHHPHPATGRLDHISRRVDTLLRIGTEAGIPLRDYVVKYADHPAWGYRTLSSSVGCGRPYDQPADAPHPPA